MKIYLKRILGRFYRPLILRIKVIIWFFPAVWSILFLGRPKKKRLLIVYDLSTQPFSVGDLLTVQEASLVLRKRYQVDFVDIAIVCDQQDPKLNDSAFKKINADNYFYHLAAVLPVAQVNPYLGSVLAFNSHLELQEYVCSNIERAYIWPSKWQSSVCREYLYYSIFEDILYPAFQDWGTLPNLESRQLLKSWAKDFFTKHSVGLVPVTVNVRNNPYFQVERNLNLEVWLEFFKYCGDNFPVKFFIICAQSEIDNRFRSLDNVMIVKDLNTNIENDLALISESVIHMGAPSGPATMAFFSDKPYLIVRSEFHLQHFTNSKIIKYRDGGVQSFFFAKPNQIFLSVPESKDLLVHYFKKIWESSDFENLKKFENLREEGGNLGSWLR